MVQHDTDNFLH